MERILEQLKADLILAAVDCKDKPNIIISAFIFCDCIIFAIDYNIYNGHR